MDVARDLANKLDPIRLCVDNYNEVFVLLRGRWQPNEQSRLSQKQIQVQYRLVLSSYKSARCSVNATAFHTPVKVYLDCWCRIRQQCVHSDVTQGWISGCSDSRRRLRLPQLKTISAGLALHLKKKWWNKCFVLSACCTLPVLCWSLTSTHTITDWSRLRQDRADKLVAHLNVGHF